MTFKPHTEIGRVTAANLVPSAQVSNEFDIQERERVPCMSAQVESTDIPGKSQPGSSNPKEILQKLDVSGIEGWEPQLQQEAQDLIHEYACIFSQNDLDLGKTSIVKHSMKLNDPIPFKE